LNDPSEQWPCHFTVAYSEAERRAYRKVVAARYVRGDTFWALVLASPITIGIVVLGAFKLGLIEASIVRPVLFATYAAFFAGSLGYHWLMRWIYRGVWNYSFDDTGVCYSNESGTIDVQLKWRAMESVEHIGSMILFWIGRRALFIPARVFPDYAARAAFVAAAASCIKAAETAKA
jgi:hypothetical protein